MENNPLSLYELLGGVKMSLKSSLPPAYWVAAEISEIKINYSGHCYLELIEKDSSGESIKAKARATIWASAYRMIQPYFETATRTKLAAGMKVMVKASVEFHELYGFSLNITDIEPSYTVGEMALKKLEIINRLIAEGVFEMNKSQYLADLPRRIAVVSSGTAAGFGDFMDQLLNNDFGYKFYVKLFPAVMQGAEAEQSIIAALDAVFEHENLFDLVVIIRGGGAQSDLNCFNSYWLAYHICQLKTPTAVAEFLIGIFRQADQKINDLSVTLAELATDLVEIENNRFTTYMLSLKPAVRKYLAASSGNLQVQGIHLKGYAKQMLLSEEGVIRRRGDRLNRLSRQLLLVSGHRIALTSRQMQEISRKYADREKHLLEMLEKKCIYLDPFLILKRGYSVTYYNGKAVKDPLTVPDHGDLSTRLAEGVLKSKKSKSTIDP
jgi:exodeoxyribonuclease VII large subunit